LVKPRNSCGGLPGNLRCETVIVLEVSDGPNPMGDHWLKIACACGVAVEQVCNFEVIASGRQMEVKPILAYSADPM